MLFKRIANMFRFVSKQDLIKTNMELKNELRGIQTEIDDYHDSFRFQMGNFFILISHLNNDKVYERAGRYLLDAEELSLSDIEYANSLYKRWLTRQINGFDNTPFVSDPLPHPGKAVNQDSTY